jgi:hypothetical protein
LADDAGEVFEHFHVPEAEIGTGHHLLDELPEQLQAGLAEFGQLAMIPLVHVSGPIGARVGRWLAWRSGRRGWWCSSAKYSMG